MEYQLDHIVLNVEDEEKMITFYTAVLHLTSERLDEYRAGEVAFPSVRLNKETIIDLFPKKLWQEMTNHIGARNNLNHFCIVLNGDEWKEIVERLRENSVELEEGPVLRWGARGNGTSVYFRDPEQNLIEVRYY